MSRQRTIVASALTMFVFHLGAPPSLPAGDAPALSVIRAQFKTPPAARRILKIVHNLPDDARGRDALVRKLTARGFGGVVANVHFDDYLQSEAKWRSFQAGVEAVRAAGMTVWLYDEQGYPSGAAGGLTLKGHPEWEARGLLCVVRDAREGEPLELKLPEGKVILLRAYPVRDGQGALAEAVDLRGLLTEDRRLRWHRPGHWRLCGFVETRLLEGTHATANLFRKRPYPNLLQAAPVERFITLTHEAYAERFESLRDRFEAIFTDEPSLMSVFLREAPHPAIPWSPTLATAFRRVKGYELVPVLPALAADFGPQGRRARCDFWDVVGREVAASYFGQIKEWCHAQGIASTGHLLAEEDLGSHVGFYGNFYACASRLDIPGIDCLTSEPPKVPWHVAKLLGSVRCLLGRRLAMSETSDHSQRYRPAGDRRPRYAVSAEEILGTLHLLYVAGINVTTSYYSWTGLDDSTIRELNEHAGRLGVVLAEGKHACDIAVLYPAESCWAHFVPQRRWANAPAVARIDATYRDVCYTLFRGRRDFDVIDAAAVAKAAPRSGVLAVGTERYRVLVLPATDVLPLEALQKAAELARVGGTVVAIGNVPLNTPAAFPSPEARKIVEEVFGAGALFPARDAKPFTIHAHPAGGNGIYIADGNGWLLPSVLGGVLEPDLRALAGSRLRYSRWRLGSKQAYFVVNDSSSPCRDEVTTRGQGGAELWDPASGEVSSLPPGPRGRYPVALRAYGSAFLVFDSVRESRPVADGSAVEALIDTVRLDSMGGAAPRLALHAPPHVEASLTPLGSGADDQGGTKGTIPPDAEKEAARPGAGGAARLPVRVTARITAGGRDSWCFAELRGTRPLDVRRFQAIEIRTRVDQDQKGSPARLLVILREDNGSGSGADYLADTRRSLGDPGLRQSAIPLETFQLAGWSHDSNGKLDRDRIQSVRIGWGGHTGPTGERIAFDLLEVNVLRIRS